MKFLLVSISALLVPATIAIKLGDAVSTTSSLQASKEDKHKHSHHVAVLIRGQSFRSGGRHSRLLDVSPDRQLNATESVVRNLVQSLEHKGFQVDVFSATYDTSWLGQLEGKFGKCMKSSVKSKCPGGQLDNVRDLLHAFQAHANRTHTTYRWVVMLRHDMKLKSDLGKIIVAAQPDDKFLFPFKFSWKRPLWKVRVPDTMQIFDGKFLGKFAQEVEKMTQWPCEFIGGAANKAAGGVNKTGFLINFSAESDTSVFQNPLFSFTQRDEGPVAPQSEPPQLQLGGKPAEICPKSK